MLKKLFILTILTVLALEASAEPAKILLTFDDGPNQETTSVVLSELQKRQAKALFFVLTGPERLFKRKPFLRIYPKAESASGFETLLDEVRQGHMIACHWGGKYDSQLNLHPYRLLDPAYDSTGDGKIDRLTEQGNALESDLIQCRDRLNEALSIVEKENHHHMIQKPGTLNYIRPPVWKYKEDDLDARPVYEAMGMKMVMTDFRLIDGGYPIQSWFPMPGRMARKTAEAIASGQSEVILTLHDSNTRTVKALPKILDQLEEALAKKGLRKGIDWEYTQNVQDIETALQRYLKRAVYED